MKSNNKSVTCFGEVLWDIFPTHKKIGGAPLNVASRINSLGLISHFVSRVGNDSHGKEILDHVNQQHMNVSLIQLDNEYQTGCVNVTLDKNGAASYEIAYPVAWDKIQTSEEALSTVRDSDAFVFGSLVCRDTASKQTLFMLLNEAKYKIFDVNLRPPFYTPELLLELLQRADFVKMNDEEIDVICKYLGYTSDSLDHKMRFIADRTDTSHVCVTLGKDGALLLFDNTFYRNKGYPVRVVDTVGAGDSFLATMVSKLLLGADPEEALDMACAIGSLVASKSGANPEITPEEVSLLRKSIA